MRPVFTSALVMLASPRLGVLVSIPSPSSESIRVGPLNFTAYGLCIALGVGAAVWLSNRRWIALGGGPNDMSRIATFAVPAGVIGARLYHLATDWRSYRGRWSEAFQIWNGGLGIWGGIALGTIVGLLVARRLRLPLPTMLDVVAPALPLAQAIGRWGNWFNQELFGRPSTLPWAVEISPANRPTRYADVATFHPTFLYESLWNIGVAIAVILVGRTLGRGWKKGRLFALYVALYTFMRFFIERIRVDPASRVWGLRINEWTSIVLFVCALCFLVRAKQRTPVEEHAVEAGHSIDAAG